MIKGEDRIKSPSSLGADSSKSFDEDVSLKNQLDRLGVTAAEGKAKLYRLGLDAPIDSICGGKVGTGGEMCIMPRDACLFKHSKKVFDKTVAGSVYIESQRSNRSIFLEPSVESSVYESTPLLQKVARLGAPHSALVRLIAAANAGDLQQEEAADDAERFLAEETGGLRYTTPFRIGRNRDLPTKMKAGTEYGAEITIQEFSGVKADNRDCLRRIVDLEGQVGEKPQEGNVLALWPGLVNVDRELERAQSTLEQVLQQLGEANGRIASLQTEVATA